MKTKLWLANLKSCVAGVCERVRGMNASTSDLVLVYACN